MDLDPGTYTLTVEDSGVPCTYIYEFVITEPDPLVTVESVSTTDVSCFGA